MKEMENENITTIVEEPVIEKPIVPQIPVEPVRKNNLFKIIIIVIGILIAVGLFANAYLMFSKKETVTKVSDSSITTAPISDSISDWKVYKYQEIFEIKIPNNLKIVDKGYGRVEIGDYFSISIYNSDPEICVGDCIITTTKETKTVSGMQIRYFTGWWGEIGGNIAQKYIEYVIPYGNKYLVLQMEELPFSDHKVRKFEGMSNVSKENTELLDQILSTFKFTDSSSPIDTTNWKTYSNNQYSYSLKYPIDWQYKEREKTTATQEVAFGNKDLENIITFYVNKDKYLIFTKNGEKVTCSQRGGKEILIGKIKGFIEYFPGGQNPAQDSVCFEKDGKAYEFQHVYLTTMDSKKIFDQILSTFKFTP